MDYVLTGKPDFEPGVHFKSYNVFKRVLDLVVACLVGAVAAVPCLIIGGLVKATSKGPALFCQKRIGRDGKPFTCYKFRTMSNDAPHNEATCTFKNAENYITGIGKILRKSSLDEVPQLLNIIKGDMSFIGPRPLIPEEEYIHAERYKRGVYFLRPGISGLAQVNGRDNLGADAKVKFDEQYLHEFSFKTDLKVVCQTVLNVLKAKDVVEGENKDLV